MIIILCVSVLVRALVGLAEHSGENLPPKYGDYECHRFWLETTYNYPPKMWYSNGAHMNTSYWPLDYPPLCAYSHWAMSHVVQLITPDAIKPEQSYGYDKPIYRALMRATLIVIELLILVPAIVKLLVVLYPKHSTTLRRVYLALFMMMPPLMFVDHGHFQPNSPMHGLVLWATYHILVGRIELAVVLMVMAANFKQMGLYFGMPFAFYALASLWRKASHRYKKSYCITRLFYVGLRILGLITVFLITLALLWYPWIKESLVNGGLEAEHGVKSVLTRIFPVWRGVF
jgi:alpha-1,3-glucosyltransferase